MKYTINPIILLSVFFTGVLAISSASILIKLCDAPAMVIASYRLTFAALFFILTSAIQKINPLHNFKKVDLILAFGSGVFLSLHFAAWITSLKFTSVASSVILVSTSPIFVALGTIIFLKEKISRLLIYGIVLTFTGSIILSLEDFSQGRKIILGDSLALLGAIAVAGYYLIGRKLRHQISTQAYVTLVYSSSALILLLFTAAFRLNFLGYSKQVYLLLFLIAFIPQVIGHTSFNWSLKYVSAALVSIITLGEPIGATILAYIFLGESITQFKMLGGLLILSGVFIAIKGEMQTTLKEVMQ
ncbi:MAG: DMT family transporter [Calditrichaeota bacterium]|nr:MAG: DMT family transporter [Calditrichota bacterium]